MLPPVVAVSAASCPHLRLRRISSLTTSLFIIAAVCMVLCHQKKRGGGWEGARKIYTFVQGTHTYDRFTRFTHCRPLSHHSPPYLPKIYQPANHPPHIQQSSYITLYSPLINHQTRSTRQLRLTAPLLPPSPPPPAPPSQSVPEVLVH